MFNREQVNKALDVLEQLTDEDADLSITSKGTIHLKCYPENWWRSGAPWPEEKRHKILALVTPLVGKLEKEIDGTTIGYRGEKENMSVHLNYADKCKVLGYKTVTKTVKREIEHDPEYEVEEVEERIAITDCDLRQGKFSEDDIEVKA